MTSRQVQSFEDTDELQDEPDLRYGIDFTVRQMVRFKNPRKQPAKDLGRAFQVNPCLTAYLQQHAKKKDIGSYPLELQVTMDYAKGLSTDQLVKKYPELKDRKEATRKLRRGMLLILPIEKDLSTFPLELQVAMEYAKGQSTDQLVKKYPELKGSTDAIRKLRKGMLLMLRRDAVEPAKLSLRRCL
jgi:uncharacterized protein (DUF433 family)